MVAAVVIEKSETFADMKFTFGPAPAVVPDAPTKPAVPPAPTPVREPVITPFTRPSKPNCDPAPRPDKEHETCSL